MVGKEQELFEQWKAEREAEVEHLNAEIFKAESYLRCLRQLKDAAVLCSYPGGMKVEPRRMTIPKEEADAWVAKGRSLEDLAKARYEQDVWMGKYDGQ